MIASSKLSSGMWSSYEYPFPSTSTVFSCDSERRKATTSFISSTHCLWNANTLRSKHRCDSKR